MHESLFAVGLLALLSSCVIHVHVHEDSQPIAASSARENGVSGTVVDAQGQPVRARVALVGASGSISSSTDDSGRFQFDAFGDGHLVVHASTDDGCIAVQSAQPGDEDMRLVLAPGATITIDFVSEQNMRCAVFRGDLRIEDFTLRSPSDRTHVAVPVGDIHVQVYGGGKSPSGGPGYTNDQRVTIAQGETKNLKFSVDPSYR